MAASEISEILNTNDDNDNEDVSNSEDDPTGAQ